MAPLKNKRELFHARIKRENGSSLLHMEQGFNITYQDWLAHGLPADVADTGNVELSSARNLYDHAILYYSIKRLDGNN